MIRSRFGYVLTLICLLLLSSQIVSAQSVTITNSDWKAVWEEYQILKDSWVILNNQVTTLEENLKKAKESQENSEMKIPDLEQRLTEALAQRDLLQEQIAILEQQLIDLGISLESTLTQIEENEGEHQQELIDIITQYEEKQSSLTFQRNALFVVVIIESVILIIASILN